jgi:ADP-heptose:LPS heptosyltransferase
MALLRWAAPRSGSLARFVRIPNPWAAPWRRAELDIVAHGGIGDVIMSTPVLRELKQRNPRCRVRFYSKFSPLVRGLPYIDEALPYQTRPNPAIYLDYSDETDFVAPRAPLVSMLGDRLGLRVSDFRMDCVVDDALVARYRAIWSDLPRPHIAIVRRASSRTINKNWPDGHWMTLIEHLSRQATVIDLGEAPKDDAPTPVRGYIDLRERTSLAELAAVISAADLHIGPLSGPAHIAAAANTPAVIIYGGYEPPKYTAYPNRIALGSNVPCSPCWLTTPCPYDRKCLHAISPKMVEDTVWRLWDQSAASQSGR